MKKSSSNYPDLYEEKELEIGDFQEEEYEENFNELPQLPTINLFPALGLYKHHAELGHCILLDEFQELAAGIIQVANSEGVLSEEEKKSNVSAIDVNSRTLLEFFTELLRTASIMSLNNKKITVSLEHQKPSNDSSFEIEMMKLQQMKLKLENLQKKKQTQKKKELEDEETTLKKIISIQEEKLKHKSGGFLLQTIFGIMGFITFPAMLYFSGKDIGTTTFIWSLGNLEKKCQEKLTELKDQNGELNPHWTLANRVLISWKECRRRFVLRNCWSLCCKIVTAAGAGMAFFGSLHSRNNISINGGITALIGGSLWLFGKSYFNAFDSERSKKNLLSAALGSKELLTIQTAHTYFQEPYTNME